MSHSTDVLHRLAVWLGAFMLIAASAMALAQAVPPGQQTLDTVLNPNAAEQARRQLQQPGNNAPVWREVRSEKEHYTPARGVEAGVLIQSGGETWRQRRNNQLIPAGGALIVAALAACALFYWRRGPMRLKEPRTGRQLLRFNGIERTAHWTVAISFTILALSGLVMLFGKSVLLPVIGHTLFAWLTMFGKNLHNFVGPVFAIGVILLFVTFVRDNLPSVKDVLWFAKGGGLFGDAHVPSGRFNGGEKVWFWIGVLVLGVTVSASGLFLNFPNFAQGRGAMQLANIIHVIATVVLMAMAAGHIYLGTIGQEGALDGMKTGYVDESWAKEHHEDWYDEVRHQTPRVPRGAAGPIPAGAPQAKEHK
jgi:formate dehydrogenase subunit gamma